MAPDSPRNASRPVPHAGPEPPPAPHEVETLGPAIEDLRRAVGSLLDQIERLHRAEHYRGFLADRQLTDIARIDDTICGLVDELARIKVETDSRIDRLERRLGP